jgi:YidC/Oxa1 family membrane protein insertase
MEDQGKRLLLAVVAAFGVMLLWQVLFPPEPPKEPQPDQVQETTETRDERDKGPTPALDSSAPKLAESDRTPTSAPVVAERGEETLFTLEAPLFRAEFTSHGGTLKSWVLKGEKYWVREGGETRQMDLVRTRGEDLLPFAVRFEKLGWPERTEWRGEKKSDTEVVFTWEYTVPTPEGQVTAFELVKTYKIYPENFLLEFTLSVANMASADDKQAIVVSLYGYQDPSEDTGGGWTQIESAWKSACYINGDVSTIGFESLRGGAKKLRAGKLAWGGFMHSYFLVAAAPHEDTGAEFACNSYGVEGQAGVMRTDIVYPVVNIRRGGPPATHSLVAYLGPKYLDDLNKIPAVVGFDPGFAKSIDLGWFEIIARPLLWLLQWFYSFLGNWGLAIIFLTVLVKLATLYWTAKSMRSMKKMAKLKPQIEAMQKKFEGDKQRQQVEMMNLYKANGVNPLAGCLPILLQMPIWFALYKMLMAAAELYHAPFIPGWIDDLTATDPYYILPVALVIMMFLQAKLSPTTADSMQQKIMMYGLPLTFGVFSFFFPAGLTLYIFTNTLLTALHHLWMNREEPRGPGKEEAGASAASKPSGAAAPKSGRGDEKARAAAEASSSDEGDARSARQPSDAARIVKKSRGKQQRRRKGAGPKGGSGGKS